MWDVKVRQGRVRLEGQQFPLVLGWESAGTIEQVGAGVTGISVGTQVMCATYQVGIGHYAQYVAVPAESRCSNSSFSRCLACCGTSCQRADCLPGDLRSVETPERRNTPDHPCRLRTGTFAVQLAAHLGAHVIGTASSRNHLYLQKLGANELIDYAQTDFADAIHAAHPEGIDAVLDCVGGDRSRTQLERGAR